MKKKVIVFLVVFLLLLSFVYAQPPPPPPVPGTGDDSNPPPPPATPDVGDDGTTTEDNGLPPPPPTPGMDDEGASMDDAGDAGSYDDTGGDFSVDVDGQGAQSQDSSSGEDIAQGTDESVEGQLSSDVNVVQDAKTADNKQSSTKTAEEKLKSGSLQEEVDTLNERVNALQKKLTKLESKSIGFGTVLLVLMNIGLIGFIVFYYLKYIKGIGNKQAPKISEEKKEDEKQPVKVVVPDVMKEYINSNINIGTKPADLKPDLLRRGWTEEQIKQAYTELGITEEQV